MKRATSIAVAAVLALLVAEPGMGLAATSTYDDDALTTATSSPVAAEVQALIEKGDAYAAEGHFGRARRAYSEAVKLQRQHGQLPARALRRIANAHYYQDRYQTAGKVLEDLAEEAAEFGDLEVQVWALADAAWIAGIAGLKLDMDRRLARLDKLMTSQFLPEDIRREVTSKRLAGIASGEYLASAREDRDR